MIYLDLYLQGFFLVFFFVYFFLCVCGGGSLAENDSLILQSPVSIKRAVNTGLKTNPIKSITWESQMSEKVNLFSNCTLLKNPNLCFVWKWNTIFLSQVPISKRQKSSKCLIHTEWGWSFYWLLTPPANKQNVRWSPSLSHNKKKYEMSQRGYKIMMVDLSRIKTPASTVLHSIYPAIHTICVYHIYLLLLIFCTNMLWKQCKSMVCE